MICACVAGPTAELVSLGSSAIVNLEGLALGTARELEADLVVAEIAFGARGAAERRSPRPIFNACSAIDSER